MYQTQKCWDRGKNKENFWNITSLKEKATGCPGMLCATWLHYGHSWRLSAPVCSCCFRCSEFPQRSWKPSFASKAWRKQDSHLVGPLESMPADPLQCVGSLQEISDKMLGFSRGGSSLTWCVAWQFLTNCFGQQLNEYQEVRKHLLFWELTVLITLWRWNSPCCVFWESLYWGLANRAPCVTRTGWEPTAQQLWPSTDGWRSTELLQFICPWVHDHLLSTGLAHSPLQLGNNVYSCTVPALVLGNTW